MYEYCGIIKPKEDEYDTTKPTFSWPERETEDIEVIYIGRKKFNRLNRQLRYLQGRMGVGAELRRKIWKLRDKMKCGNIQDINMTKDILSLCFSFISFQRHSQCKIVSNLQSSSFLKKGESKVYFQNNPGQLSTFEDVLVSAALKQDHKNLDLKALTAVITPYQVFEYKQKNKQIEGGDLKIDQDGKNEDDDEGKNEGNSDKLDIGWNWEEYVKYIDDTALLMEEYIIIHGNGSFDNLCFKKGVRGGARGPVDDYNLLCDIMKSYVKRFKDGIKQFEMNYEENLNVLKSDNYGYGYILKNGLPETNHKFLAKDIMHWNNAWKDDAFANGKRPDWCKWLAFRRKDGVIAPCIKQCH